MKADIHQILDQAIAVGNPWKAKGTVASYIPELAKADPEHFGISLMNRRGELYSVGDDESYFTIQSIVKCCFLLFALDHWGEEKVFSLVHMEPSGASFQSPAITTAPTHVPSNPFINAGALVLCSLIASEFELDDFIGRIAPLFGSQHLKRDDKVYHSEYHNSSANRQALAELNELQLLHTGSEETLQYYVDCCSRLVTTKQLAHLGWSIQHLPEISARHRLILKTLMLTCGMYNGSGEYALNVGVPSKSGVGGGLVAIHPDYCLGLYSPPLDLKGNSLAAVKAMKFLSKSLRLHLFDRDFDRD